MQVSECERKYCGLSKILFPFFNLQQMFLGEFSLLDILI